MQKQTLTKAIQGKLVPIGKTLKLLEEAKQGKGEIADAVQLDKDMPIVKKVVDDFYRDYIAKWLTSHGVSYKLSNEAYKAFANPDDYAKAKADIEKKLKESMNAVELCGSKYNSSMSFMAKESLIPYAKNKDYDCDTLAILLKVSEQGSFYNKLGKPRAKLFNGTDKAGSVISRIVNDNMPLYFANCLAIEQIKEENPDALKDVAAMELDEIAPDLYCDYFTQEQIDKYNHLIGEINTKTNLYSQATKKKIRKLVRLQKIPLFETEKLFTIEKIENDEQFLALTRDTHTFAYEKLQNLNVDIKELFTAENMKKISVPKGNLHNMSQIVYGRHGFLESAINYHKDKLSAKEQKKSDKLKSYKLEELIAYINEYVVTLEDVNITGEDIISFYRYKADEIIKDVAVRYNAISKALSGTKFDRRKGADFREFYDACISLHQTYKSLIGDDSEQVTIYLKEFLSEYAPVIKNYNLARNYATRKPFDTKKIEVNFGASDFGVGDSHYINKSRTFWMTKDGFIYLCVVPKNSRIYLDSLMAHKGEGYKFLYWHQLTDIARQIPRIFIKSKAAAEKYGVTDEIRYICDNKTYKTDKDAELKWITYIYNCFVKSEDYAVYNLAERIRKPYEYENYIEFYNELEYALYTIELIGIDEKFIESAVENGELYQFKFMRKDFTDSHIRKGSHDDTHTRIIKALFGLDNANNTSKMLPHIELIGGTKVFYRTASLERKVTHKAGIPLANKNPNNPRKTKTLAYDLIKNKRYTEDTLLVSLCVNLRVNEEGTVSTFNNNKKVNQKLKEEPKNIMAIVRGSAHLLYYTVTSPDGKILEENSLNELEYNINTKAGTYRVTNDYKASLEKAKASYEEAVRNWAYHKGIQEIKEGYLSAALGEIVKIRDKYDALIVVEDMNARSSGRATLDSKIYGTFEKKLVNKLNCVYRPNGSVDQYTIIDNYAYRSQNGIVYTMMPYYLANKMNDDYTDTISYLFRYQNHKQALNTLGKIKLFFKKGEFYATVKYSDLGENNFTDKEFTFKVDGEYTVFVNKKYELIDTALELKESFDDCGIDYSDGIDTSMLDVAAAKRVLEALRLTFSCKDVLDGETIIRDNLVSVDGKAHKKDGKHTTLTQLKCKNLTERLICELKTIDEEGKIDYGLNGWLDMA